MTAAPASVQLTHDGSSLADAIRWRVLLLLQDVDVPVMCESAGIDPRRLKDLLAEPRPSAELVALVARFARVPVAEVMFGHSDESTADSRLASLTAATHTDLLQHFAGRLSTLEGRIERALLALMEVEARLSAAGLTPSDLIPPDLIPLYAPLTAERATSGGSRK